ncbi:Flp family type IVb pilin [uncultured Methylobacterium sp.]|uniref:Flp family type IVb pilin n=1 Tax=uncultured Methylobacterium sp. TaxID=157278 RepID=UPI0035CAD490
MLPPVVMTRSEKSAGKPGISKLEAAGMIGAATRFGRDERGATAIEYALIAGLVFLALVLGVQSYTTNMRAVYTVIEAAVTSSK